MPYDTYFVNIPAPPPGFVKQLYAFQRLLDRIVTVRFHRESTEETHLTYSRSRFPAELVLFRDLHVFTTWVNTTDA